jgi:hypothetical protein
MAQKLSPKASAAKKARDIAAAKTPLESIGKQRIKEPGKDLIQIYTMVLMDLNKSINKK